MRATRMEMAQAVGIGEQGPTAAEMVAAVRKIDQLDAARPGGPQARQKSVPQGRTAAQFIVRSKGPGFPKKQNERLAGRRGVHFSHDGTVMPCLPVSPILVLPLTFYSSYPLLNIRTYFPT